MFLSLSGVTQNLGSGMSRFFSATVFSRTPTHPQGPSTLSPAELDISVIDASALFVAEHKSGRAGRVAGS
jgi:hypothetical protein